MSNYIAKTDTPRCPECDGAFGINPRRIGEYVCYGCGYRHLEDVKDESTWLPRDGQNDASRT